MRFSLRRAARLFALLSLFVLSSLSSRAHASGVDPTKISLPKGPASIDGLGRNFAASAATGTASFGVDVVVPPAVGGFGPKLSFDYDGGGGVSDLGIGWQLSGIPKICRRTENGLPRFDDSDVFELRGFGAAADLLEVSPGVLRAEEETGAFVRVTRSADARTWEARTKSGITFRFGGSGFEEAEEDRVACYLPSEELDPHGHRVGYEWTVDEGHALLARIVWNDFSDASRLEITAAYEARPDVHELFSSGIREVLGRRLTALEARQGQNLVRRYELSYGKGTISELAAIRMLGADGMTALPSLRFEYTEPSFGTDGQIVTMTSPPGRSPGEADVDLADVNGDSLPDLLVAVAGQYQSYVNKDGASWAPAEAWGTTESPSVSLSTLGAQLADVDGDGAVDLLVKSGTTDFRYFPGLDATSFAAAVSIPTVPNFLFEDPDVRLADMDGDRRVDVAITTTTGLAIGYNVGGTDWAVPEPAGVVDSSESVRFSDGRTDLCDINGDRVNDICSLRSGALVYWLGRGRGRFEPARTASGVPTFDVSDPWRLVDLNGDGWVDSVHVGVDHVEYALATAAGVFDSPRVIAGTPTKWSSVAVEFADMNGSGTTDILWVDPAAPPNEAWRYLEIFPNGRGGLLRKIDNGLGRTTSIEYEPAALHAARARAAGTPWTTRTNLAMSVVSRVTVDSGLGDPPLVTELAYRNGTWDPVERTFAGFGAATQSEVGDDTTPTLVTETTFDTGLDVRALRGEPLIIERRDGEGHVFTRATNEYTRLDVDTSLDGPAIRYGYRASELVEHVEGGTTPRTTLTEWTQDQYGNAIEEDKWGEVAGDDVLVGNDEALVTRTFAVNTTDWLLDRVASEELQAGQGNRVMLKRTYYDGDAFKGLPLGQATRGDVMRVESWIDGDHFADEERHQLDDDGNITVLLNARGGRVEFDYDAESHTFITRERQFPDPEHSLEWTAEYDRRFGQVTELVDPNGDRSSFRYDALGRVVAMVQPGDTLDLPTRSFEYHLASPVSSVREEQRERSGERGTITTISYFDGLGRERGVLKEGAEAGTFVAEKLSAYDARGNRFFEAYPAIETSADLPSLAGRDGTWTRFDAMGRPITVKNVDGSERHTEYSPLGRTEWDENDTDLSSAHTGTPTTYAFDGLDRLRQVTERDGSRSLVTGDYAYDPAGKITRVTDARSNARAYEYDGRSRRTHIADPNAGQWRLQYDDGNDLVRRIDPAGNIVRFAYDDIGRVLEEWQQASGASETRAVQYHYDAPSDDHPELGHAATRLAWVEDQAGAVFFGYTARGLENDRIRRWADGTEHLTHTDFDAANRMIGRGFPDHSYLDIEYDARGSVRSLGPVAPDITWTPSGQIDRLVLGNGVTDAHHYDARQRLDRLEAKTSAGAMLRGLHYNLDPASRITSVEDLRPSVTPERSLSSSYTFDDRYRLLSAKDATGSTTWTYDDTGNTLSVESTHDAPFLNVANEFGENGAGPDTLTHHGDEELRYDAAGRLIQDGERTLTWDAKGRLACVERGGVVEEYTYGFDDTRAVKTTTRGEKRDVVRYIDQDVEERNGALIRYTMLEGQRLARLDNIPNTDAPASLSGIRGGSAARMPRAPPFALAMERIGRMPADRVMSALMLGALTLAYLLSSRRRRFALPASAFLLMLSCDSGVGQKKADWRHIDELPESAVFYFTDAQSNPVAIADAVGTAISETSYYPYGAVRGSEGDSKDPFSFTGNERDAGTGLGDFVARPYRAELGIFLAPDPVALFTVEKTLEEPVKLAPYAYGAGDPINRLDPSGTEPNDKGTLSALKERFDHWLTHADYPGSSFIQSDKKLAQAQEVAETVATEAGMAAAGEGAIRAGVQIAKWGYRTVQGLRAARAVERGMAVVSAAKAGAKVVEAAASKGARTEARNLAEQLTLQEAESGAGSRIMQGKINDPRFPEDTWAKMQHVHTTPDGTKIVVHYWERLSDAFRTGFKFKD